MFYFLTFFGSFCRSGLVPIDSALFQFQFNWHFNQMKLDSAEVQPHAFKIMNRSEINSTCSGGPGVVRSAGMRDKVNGVGDGGCGG